jgi:hypothetical protein
MCSAFQRITSNFNSCLKLLSSKDRNTFLVKAQMFKNLICCSGRQKTGRRCQRRNCRSLSRRPNRRFSSHSVLGKVNNINDAQNLNIFKDFKTSLSKEDVFLLLSTNFCLLKHKLNSTSNFTQSINEYKKYFYFLLFKNFKNLLLPFCKWLSCILVFLLNILQIIESQLIYFL